MLFFHVMSKQDISYRPILYFVSSNILYFFLVVPAPRDLQINQSGATSFTFSWSKAEELEKVPQRFVISYCIPGTEPCAANTEDSYRTLSGLLPGTQYTISVSTVLNNGEQSKPLSTTICTSKPHTDSLHFWGAQLDKSELD